MTGRVQTKTLISVGPGGHQDQRQDNIEYQEEVELFCLQLLELFTTILQKDDSQAFAIANFGMPAIFNTLAYYAVLPNRAIREWQANPNQFVMDDEEQGNMANSCFIRPSVNDVFTVFV